VLSFASDAIKQVLYPQQAGLFSKLGYQLQLQPMGSGSAIISALVGGSGDFGSGSLFALFTAFGHGIPLRIVAPIALYDTDHCDSWLVVRSDSGLHQARDLNGKVMGGDTPSEISVVATKIWMDRHDGDGKSLRALGLNGSEILNALLAGRIDTAVLRPPFLTVAMQSGRVRVIGKPLDVIAPRFLLSAWVASVDYIDKNPAAVKAWVTALTAGARYVDRHQDETVDMVAQFTKQDPAQIRAGVRTVIAESITLADVQTPLDFAYKYGVIDKPYDARAMLSEYVPVKRA
jgi:ABC-type nitrate/sulfonate/bicarbonate transport system substrate-binding protein